MFKTIAVTNRNTETQLCSRGEGSRTEVEGIFKNVSVTRKGWGGGGVGTRRQQDCRIVPEELGPQGSRSPFCSADQRLLLGDGSQARARSSSLEGSSERWMVITIQGRVCVCSRSAVSSCLQLQGL